MRPVRARWRAGIKKVHKGTRWAKYCQDPGPSCPPSSLLLSSVYPACLPVCFWSPSVHGSSRGSRCLRHVLATVVLILPSLLILPHRPHILTPIIVHKKYRRYPYPSRPRIDPLMHVFPRSLVGFLTSTLLAVPCAGHLLVCRIIQDDEGSPRH